MRRDEQNNSSLTNEEKKVIKGSRYLLLRNEENLKEKEKSKLEGVNVKVKQAFTGGD